MKSKLLIISIISLVICVVFISSTYAVFETNSSGNANMTIGNWVIKLNDILISTSNEQSFSVDDFIYNTTANFENGYFAPGTNGYFDLVLDPSGTDVAIKYTISFDLEEIPQENINISIDSSSTIRTGESTYSGVIDVDDIENEEILTLRVYLNWLNDTSYDESDTELGIVQNNKLRIPVTVNVVQYMGETITEYVPPEDGEEE